MFGGHILTGIGLALVLVTVIIFVIRQNKDWDDITRDRIARSRRRRG